ncbi:hypothetical protein SCB29_33850 [Paraburkholderia sp. SIMBA_055]
MRPEEMMTAEKHPPENLVKIAQGDTGQSRRVADFRLAWWNPASCGSYDLTAAWGVDEDIMEDMCVVFRLASRSRSYPDSIGYEKQFEAIVRAWRPELAESERCT